MKCQSSVLFQNLSLSYDTLTAVLNPIVPNGSPVVDTLANQPVRVSLRFLVWEPFTRWEQILLHHSHRVFALDETSKVLLTHHHHFNEYNYLVSMFLQRHETLLHKIAEFVKPW